MADRTDVIEHELVYDGQFDALNIQTGSAESPEDELLSKKYPAKSHARKVAAELFKTDTLAPKNSLIYLPGEPERLYEDSDQGPDFRQRRYFFYITGVNFADCAVTYEIQRDRLILWIPYIEPRKVLYFGDVPDAATALGLYDVDDVRYTNDLPRFLAAHLGPSATLFALHRSQTPRYLFADERSRLGDAAAAISDSDDVLFPPERKPGAIDVVSLKPAMDRARVVKDEYEIALIRRANDISSAAHRHVARQLLRLSNEQDIEALLVASCTARGAHSQAYHIIAGAGANASTLHYDANDQPLAGKELVVIDAGCEYNLYASDITRTLPVSGSYSAEGAAIYAIVERMQEECIAGVTPGRRFRELHVHAGLVAARGLHAIGLLKGDLAEVEASGVAGAFFPHGLGHHVGLEVHDVSGDQRLMSSFGGVVARLEGGKREMVTPAELAEMTRQERIAATAEEPVKHQHLQPGMIVTVEPGIYFCRPYIEGYFLSQPRYARFIDRDVLERFYPVGGVRIEDCILVTEDGNENLTTAPKGQELLDIINGEYELV